MICMVLRCTCGGSVEVQSATYPEDARGKPTGVAIENYECQSCGATGTYRFGERDGQHVEEMSGCLTTEQVYD